MDKICGQCRQPFSCGQEGGCWCNEVQLSRDQLAWIKARFDNCLCPRCLRAVAAGRLSDGGVA